MEEKFTLYIRYKVCKWSGIQNLRTDHAIRHKLIFLTRFDTYLSYLIKYYVLIVGST